MGFSSFRVLLLLLLAAVVTGWPTATDDSTLLYGKKLYYVQHHLLFSFEKTFRFGYFIYVIYLQRQHIHSGLLSNVGKTV